MTEPSRNGLDHTGTPASIKYPPGNPKHNDRAGHVYIITGGDLCKIGMTRDNIFNRLRGIQNMSPAPLYLVCATWFDSNAAWAERWIQWMFRDDWHHGEWFALDNEGLHEAIGTLNAFESGYDPRGGIYDEKQSQ